MKSKSLVLLVNLGSPEQLSAYSIKKFLKAFLSDSRVVSIPKIIWLPLLKFLILPKRSKKLVNQYKKVWIYKDNNECISPLIYYTQKQKNELSKLVAEDIIIENAFCYSEAANINAVLSLAHSKYNISNLLLIPLYPQFSTTTTLSLFDQVYKFYKSKMYLPTINFLHGFNENDLYIKALVTQIKTSWNNFGRGEKLIFSYHSLPKKIIENGDVYYKECLRTTELIVKQLSLNEDEYKIAFQSKFGWQDWLQPSTSNILYDLAKTGTKNIDIICPGFVSDCLETLEEIAILNKDLFLSNGGVIYNYIPCLNENQIFIKMLYEITKKYF